MYRLAGVIGVDPTGLTLRELVWMAEGAQEERWNHTAILRAEIRAPWSKQRVRVSDLHPFAKRRQQPARIDPHGAEKLARELCDNHQWARK